MPKLIFTPSQTEIDVETGTKVLAAALRGKLPIRFGCASCRCGTCGVAVSGDGELSPMKADEKALLERMGLATDGSVRLSCQARATDGTVSIDLDFQLTYSPDDGDD